MTPDQADPMDRIAALHREIEERRAELTRLRRELPAEPIRDYTLTRSDGTPVTLGALFGDRDELLLVHNMGRECAYCTLWADGFNGVQDHLIDRVPFVVSSPDSPDEQRAFAEARAWRFQMVSTAGTTFAEDLGFYVPGEGYWPGVSAFRRLPTGEITRVARDFFGPGDTYCSVWHFFDLLPPSASDWGPRLRYD